VGDKRERLTMLKKNMDEGDNATVTEPGGEPQSTRREVERPERPRGEPGVGREALSVEEEIEALKDQPVSMEGRVDPTWGRAIMMRLRGRADPKTSLEEIIKIAQAAIERLEE